MKESKERLFKVYSKCAYTTNPIEEITLEEARKIIEEQISLAETNGYELPDNAVEKGLNDLKKYKILGCGDFNLEYSLEIPDRPNSTSNDIETL